MDLILRSGPDVVADWDDTEGARRRWLIRPVRRNSAGDPGPARADQETIAVYLPGNQVLTSKTLRELARTRSLEQWINDHVEGIPHAEHD